MEGSDECNKRLLPEIYRGERFTIVHCEDAVESYYREMRSERSNKIRSMAERMISLMLRLGRGEILSAADLAPEAQLPNGQRFYAFKRLPIRAYLWRSDLKSNTYFISHYKVKLEDPLDPKDTARVIRNWKRIEVENEER